MIGSNPFTLFHRSPIWDSLFQGDYTTLPYLKNASSTKIDTQVTQSSMYCEFYLRFYCGTTDSFYIFQSRQYSNGPIYGISGSSTGATITAYLGTGNVLTSTISRVIGHTYEIIFKVSDEGNASLYVKDEDTGESDVSTATFSNYTAATTSLYLFSNGVNSIVSGTKILRAKYRENSVLLLDLFSTKRDIDDVFGYYNLVTNTFLTPSSGSVSYP